MAAKPDKRKTVWKKLLERAQSHSAEPLKGRAARGYVADQVRRASSRCARTLSRSCSSGSGRTLRRLMGELEKLEAFAEGHAGPLSAEEVSAILGRGWPSPSTGSGTPSPPAAARSCWR
jgi:DNA polymerase III delta subunit